MGFSDIQLLVFTKYTTRFDKKLDATRSRKLPGYIHDLWNINKIETWDYLEKDLDMTIQF